MAQNKIAPCVRDMGRCGRPILPQNDIATEDEVVRRINRHSFICAPHGSAIDAQVSETAQPVVGPINSTQVRPRYHYISHEGVFTHDQFIVDHS
jgi:hypothetical protein